MTSLLLLTRAMPGRLPLYLDLVRWNRPAGWLLLLWPTLAALWVASAGFPGWHLLAVFTAGTVLMRSAGCCVNDVADRHFDRHVKRTAQRPVTRGAVSVREALILAAVLALAAFVLVLTTNASTVIWSFAALAITVAYPYAKRHVAMPQAVLGLAFSAGIPMAFTAVQGGESWIYTAVLGADSWLLAAIEGGVPGVAWWLLLGNLFWVLAYDTEYAMVDRDDDLRIGMKTSAITLGRFDVPAVVVFYLLFLAIWTMALRPYRLGPAFDVALAVAVVQVFWHWTMIRRRTREGCFRAFRVNHWLGFTMFAGVAAGFAFRTVCRLG
ncbi:4-hydroxybenzoate octaprenyltransferase [Sphingomonas sp. NCPPB 2930]